MCGYCSARAGRVRVCVRGDGIIQDASCVIKLSAAAVYRTKVFCCWAPAVRVIEQAYTSYSRTCYVLMYSCSSTPGSMSTDRDSRSSQRDEVVPTPNALFPFRCSTDMALSNAVEYNSTQVLLLCTAVLEIAQQYDRSALYKRGGEIMCTYRYVDNQRMQSFVS